MSESDLGHIHSISDGGFWVSQVALRKSSSRIRVVSPSIYTSNEGPRNRHGSVFFCAVVKCWRDLTYSPHGRVLGWLSGHAHGCGTRRDGVRLYQLESEIDQGARRIPHEHRASRFPRTTAGLSQIDWFI